MVIHNNTYFLVSDYFATGEGMSKWMLITRYYPEPEQSLEDIEKVLRNYFAKVFNDFAAIGMEVVEENDFWERYRIYVPDFVYNIVEKNDAGDFQWSTQLYLNYS